MCHVFPALAQYPSRSSVVTRHPHPFGLRCLLRYTCPYSRELSNSHPHSLADAFPCAQSPFVVVVPRLRMLPLLPTFRHPHHRPAADISISWEDTTAEQRFLVINFSHCTVPYYVYVPAAIVLFLCRSLLFTVTGQDAALHSALAHKSSLTVSTAVAMPFQYRTLSTIFLLLLARGIPH